MADIDGILDLLEQHVTREVDAGEREEWRQVLELLVVGRRVMTGPQVRFPVSASEGEPCASCGKPISGVMWVEENGHARECKRALSVSDVRIAG